MWDVQDAGKSGFDGRKLKMIKQILAICLVITALAGYTTKNIPEDFSFSSETTNKGIIAVSVSHDLAAGRLKSATVNMAYMGEGLTIWEQLFIPTQISSRSRIDTTTGIGLLRRSDFKDSYGRLLVLALPPGRYAIKYWHFTGDIDEESLYTRGGTPLEFDVVPGQVTYLGNLHAHMQVGKISGVASLACLTCPVAGFLEVRDQQQRDIAMLEKKYPQFKGKVVNNPLPLGPWTESPDNRK